jgi:hypothetical protein
MVLHLGSVGRLPPVRSTPEVQHLHRRWRKRTQKLITRRSSRALAIGTRCDVHEPTRGGALPRPDLRSVPSVRI